jgi:hypothetical protein
MGDAHAPRPRRFGACVSRVSAVALVASLAGIVVAACGSKGTGVDVCKQVDTARCQAAPACGIQLTTPVYTSGTAVEACTQYYDVACFNGLQVAAPTSAEVSACVAAINAGDCTCVATPQDCAACAWLSTSPDAGEDAATAEASSDAADAADAAEAGDVVTEAEGASD